MLLNSGVNVNRPKVSPLPPPVADLDPFPDPAPVATGERPRFVLAANTFRRAKFLQKCLESFAETRSDMYDWQVLIVDDGSPDEATRKVLRTAEILSMADASIVFGRHRGYHAAANDLLHELADMRFDLCFRCDDDVVFTAEGWDTLYHNAVQSSGFGHLIFGDPRWKKPHFTKRHAVHPLMAYWRPADVMGALYTLTPKVLADVGYFDTAHFGESGFGHVDFSIRAARAGNNDPACPWDAAGAHRFIALQDMEQRRPAVPWSHRSKQHPAREIQRKRRILRDPNRPIRIERAECPELPIPPGVPQ